MSEAWITRIARTKLWSYENASEKKMLLHHRVAGFFLFTWLWAGGTMAICIFEICFLGRIPFFPEITIFTKFTIVLCLCAVAIGFAFAVPATFSMALMKEIEEVFARRGTPIPASRLHSRRLNATIFKLVLFCALPFSIVIAFREPSLLNLIQACVWACVLWGLFSRVGREGRRNG